MLKIRNLILVLGVLMSPLAVSDAQVSVGIGFPHVSIGFNVPAYPQTPQDGKENSSARAPPRQDRHKSRSSRRGGTMNAVGIAIIKQALAISVFAWDRTPAPFTQERNRPSGGRQPGQPMRTD